MADPVRHVPEEEFLAARHPGVPDDQDVDRLVLGGTHDRHRGVVVDHHVRVSALARELRRVDLQLVGGAVRPRRLGRPVLRVGRVLRDDHLHDVELGAEPLGERGRPLDRSRGGLGSVGAHHHPADRAHGVGVDGCHARIMAPRVRSQPMVRAGGPWVMPALIPAATWAVGILPRPPE